MDLDGWLEKKYFFFLEGKKNRNIYEDSFLIYTALYLAQEPKEIGSY